MSSHRAGSSTIGDVFSDDLGVGAALGAGAFLVSYALTYVFTAIDGIQLSSDVATWKQVGWVFYGAHFVSTETRISAAGRSQSGSYNPVTDAPATADITSVVPGFVYHLVPIIVLVLAGALAYQRVGGTSSTKVAAAAGATVVVGYLVLAVVGRFMLTVSHTGSYGTLSVGPPLLESIVLVGIVYPVVFGGIAGILESR